MDTNTTPTPAGAPQNVPSGAGTSTTSTGTGKNTLMGVLCYLGPLVFIPFFVAKDDPFVKFHIKQGLVVFVIELVAYLLPMLLWIYFLSMLMNLIMLAALILSVIGIINVVQGKETELPLVGSFGKHFPI